MSDYRRKTIHDLSITLGWKRRRVKSLEDELQRERRDLAELEQTIDRLQGNGGLWWALLLMRLDRWIDNRNQKRKRE